MVLLGVAMVLLGGCYCVARCVLGVAMVLKRWLRWCCYVVAVVLLGGCYGVDRWLQW